MYATRILDMLNHKLDDPQNQKFKAFTKMDAVNEAQEEIMRILREGDPTHGLQYHDYTVSSDKVVPIPSNFIAVYDWRNITGLGYGFGGYGSGGYGEFGGDGSRILMVDKRHGILASDEVCLIGHEFHFGAEVGNSVRLYYTAHPLPMFRAKVSSVTDEAIFAIGTTPLLGELLNEDDIYIGSWLHVQEAEGNAYEIRQIEDYTASTGGFELTSELTYLPTTSSYVELATSVPMHMHRYIAKIAQADLLGNTEELTRLTLRIVDGSTRNLQTNRKVADAEQGFSEEDYDLLTGG